MKSYHTWACLLQTDTHTHTHRHRAMDHTYQWMINPTLLMCPIMSFFNLPPSLGKADLHQLINEHTEGNLGHKKRTGAENERRISGTSFDRYITGKKAEGQKTGWMSTGFQDIGVFWQNDKVASEQEVPQCWCVGGHWPHSGLNYYDRQQENGKPFV